MFPEQQWISRRALAVMAGGEEVGEIIFTRTREALSLLLFCL